MSSVYVMGDGWTGALGTGRLDQSIPGHTDDDDDVDAHSWMDDYGSDTSTDPVKIYDAAGGKILCAAAGWGHTALIFSPSVSQRRQKESAAANKLIMCGRPHDFQALLRLRRLPKFLRQYAVNGSARPQYEWFDKMVASITGMSSKDVAMWEMARQHSMLPILTEMPFPEDDSPVLVKASAGITSVLGASGKLYTMGINNRGQCGIGKVTNHVWYPQPVVGFHPYEGEKASDVDHSRQRITSVALGLQHGLCLNDRGHLFTWGKGQRGQLGQGGGVEESLDAVRVAFFNAETQRMFAPQPAIRQVAAGLNFSAALLHNNQVYLWGKNILPAPTQPVNSSRTHAHARHPHRQDAIRPQTALGGLPKDVEILQIACGLHHIAILLEDGSVYGAGVPVDQAKPILEEPILMVPPGMLELPLQQFTAHFDRTTMVSRNGTQVLQSLLCAEESLRDYATFSPPWVDRLLDRKHRIQEVHRGWLHTVVVTK